MTKIAVLTGDLINSTGVSSPKRFRTRLDALLKDAETRYSGKAVTFRGDGFQVSLPNPTDGIECALYLRAGLISASPSRHDRWDARISVAIAEASTNDDAYGDAYIESGRRLDEMTRQNLQVYAEPPAFQISAALATTFVDDIISNWTPSEAEAYFTHLKFPDGHEAVAKHLKKSRPTVTKSLIRAKYTLLNRYLQDSLALMEITHAV